MKSQFSYAYVLPFVFVSALAAAPALAQTKPSPAPKAEAKPESKSDADTQAILKFSQDGNAALRDIEAARLSILRGKPKLAIDEIAKAKINIEKGEREAEVFLRDSSAKPGGAVAGRAEMIPVDGQLMVVDDFVPTDEKQAHVASANEHFKKGEHEAALKELSLSDVKVIYNRLWMPIAPAYKHLDQALKLMDKHKYYEANLALKAIGDSLTIESMSLTETPKKAPEEPAAASQPE